ncbi:MAG: hypothetical protein HFI14_06235 [Lachnospiraceae bacterium]|nr:hypothetical protein [Lachnospiraceae bacterium]
MWILPSLDYEMHSSRTLEDVVMLLKTVTKQPKKKSLVPTSGEFAGEIIGSVFKITPTIWYRNSYVPVIQGQIRSVKGGSVISIQMRMHPFVSGFSLLWLSGVFFGFLCGLLSILAGNPAEGLPFLVISGAMIAAEQLMTRYAFYYPAERALQRLSDLLEETDAPEDFD